MKHAALQLGSEPPWIGGYLLRVGGITSLVEDGLSLHKLLVWSDQKSLVGLTLFGRFERSFEDSVLKKLTAYR